MNPIFSIPYIVPKVNEERSKKWVESLVLLGILEKSNDSEWGYPYFAQPKPKTNQVRFKSDFRNLNIQLNRKPYQMSKINEMLLNL